MVFGCECIPHLSPMTHNEQDTHESFGVALIMVMSFVDLSSPKSPLAFVVTVNDCAFKIVILLLVSLSSLLYTSNYENSGPKGPFLIHKNSF